MPLRKNQGAFEPAKSTAVPWIRFAAAARIFGGMTGLVSLIASNTSLFCARRLLARLVNWHVLDHFFGGCFSYALMGSN
jgi:hypothetical protein